MLRTDEKASRTPHLHVVLEGRLLRLQLLGQKGALQAQVHRTLQASVAGHDDVLRQPAQRLGHVLLYHL